MGFFCRPIIADGRANKVHPSFMFVVECGIGEKSHYYMNFRSPFCLPASTTRGAQFCMKDWAAVQKYVYARQAAEKGKTLSEKCSFIAEHWTLKIICFRFDHKPRHFDLDFELRIWSFICLVFDQFRSILILFDITKVWWFLLTKG